MSSVQQPSFARFSPNERREAILDAARAVFTETGLAAARTKDIAARAGVAEGLIFKHFRTKDALFELAVVDRLDELVERIGAAATAFATSIEMRDRTAQAITFHTEILGTMLEIAPLLGSVLFDQRAIGQSFYDRRIVPTIDRITEALTLTIGGSNGADAAGNRLLAMMIWGTHFALAVDADYGNAEIDVDRLAKNITKLLTAGLVRRPDQP